MSWKFPRTKAELRKLSGAREVLEKWLEEQAAKPAAAAKAKPKGAES